jgi:hypothetical protein
MERRDSQRIKRRLLCEFEHEGQVYSGIVADLSASGLFLQTDVAIEPESDLVLRLEGERFPELTLRGRVARRRFTPAVLSSIIRRGVGVRLMEAPPEWRQALGVEPEPKAEPLWGAVGEWGPAQPAAPGEPVSLDIRVASESEARPLPPPALPGDETLPLVSPIALDEPPGELAPEPPSPEPAPAPLCRAAALLIGASELDDVHALLEALGVTSLHQRALDAGGFSGWEEPPRLVVAGSRSALRLAVGAGVESQGIVTIAVVDSDSQRLCGQLRRQGFRYVVRRPVHPEALRLLLLRALFRGRDRRDTPRHPFGCEVGLGLWLRRKPATLLELSRTGCRVLGGQWVEAGERVRIRVPATVTGNRPLILPGRVLRSEHRPQAPRDQRVAFALRFERLAEETRARLDALLVAHALGPAPLPRLPAPAVRPKAAAPTLPAREAALPGPSAPAPEPEPASAPALPAAERSPPGLAAPAEAPPVEAELAEGPLMGAPAPFGEVAAAERRRRPRSPHRQEVLALEPGDARVRHVLLGVDLSRCGIRVEPHPELGVGDRVRLAIYDAACDEPLVVEADAVRDDGEAGLLLRFCDLSEGAARELVRIVARAPQIESAVGGAGRPLFVTEMLDSRPA